MKEENKPINPEEDQLDVIENQTTEVTDSDNSSGGNPEGNTPVKFTDQNAEDSKGNTGPKMPENGSKKKQKGLIWRIIGRFNIYLLLFILLLVVAGAVSAIAFFRGQQEEPEELPTVSINEPLSQEVLDQLRATDVTVGDPKQILTVESNAIFGGTVLVRGGLEVAGAIRFGGPLSLPGLTVSGTTNLDILQAQQLQVAGNTTIQGQLVVEQGITVNGNANVSGALFVGSLTVQDLQVGRDLIVGRHLVSNGATPGKTNGSALGGGGTASVSGNDTTGTVNVSTGNSPGGGCFATITFTERYDNPPSVIVTPIGAATGNLNWYVERSAGDFRVCANNPAGGQTYGFDYFVIN